MKLFECTSIVCSYTTIPVLNNISLTINNGDFIGIIGPNGAGKSTLLKCLARILAPASGTIYYNGSDITAIPKKQYAQQVATVMEIEHLLPYTVESFVALGRFPHSSFGRYDDEDISIIDNAIAYCSINTIKNKKLTQLSSGELQRVNIARALAQSTQCILLDEPISHLDIRHTIAIMDILKNLHKRGSTIITIIHDINIASEYCSRIIGLKQGTIIFDDTPEKCITYHTIEKLFDCICLVYNNPLSNKPFVYPVPGHIQYNKHRQ